MRVPQDAQDAQDPPVSFTWSAPAYNGEAPAKQPFVVGTLFEMESAAMVFLTLHVNNCGRHST
jgi:hypothetical protein